MPGATDVPVPRDSPVGKSKGVLTCGISSPFSQSEMEAIVEYLNLTLTPPPGFAGSAWFVPPGYWENICQGRTYDWRRISRRIGVDPERVEAIAIPIFQGAVTELGHWTAAVILPKEQKILYLDSCQWAPPERLGELLTGFYRSGIINDGDADCDFTVQIIKSHARQLPPQTNSTDCGPMSVTNSISYVLHHLYKLPLVEYTMDKCPEIRKAYIHSILAGAPLPPWLVPYCCCKLATSAVEEQPTGTGPAQSPKCAVIVTLNACGMYMTISPYFLQVIQNNLYFLQALVNKSWLIRHHNTIRRPKKTNLYLIQFHHRRQRAQILLGSIFRFILLYLVTINHGI